MIELTEQQIQAVETANGTPAHVVNPRTNETFVLVPLADYKRLTDDAIDYNPLLSAAKKRELDRRLADAEAHPEDGVPWEEIKAAALARYGE